MTTSMSSTFHVQLFPTIPPTNDTLEPEQRSYHRLRSTRKLEALFLDLDSKIDTMPSKAPTVISPRTRSKRRKGHVYHSQSSSSLSSIESDSIFVNGSVGSDLYRIQSYSPSSSSCSSSSCSSRGSSLDMKPTVTKENSSRSEKSGEAKVGGSTGNKVTRTGSKIIAQPFLLQLRSLPVPPTSTRIKSETLPVDQSKPCSPMSLSSFTMHTPTTIPRHILTDSEKRKKLAKLTRTLGENVPPELVFPSSPPLPLPLQRTTSMWGPRPRKSPSSSSSSSSHKPSQSVLPIVVETPTPAAASQQQQLLSLPPSVQSDHYHNHPRQRSMTMSASTAAYHPIDQPFQKTVEAGITDDALSLEWGKRKEKEWSGEWNVKDMERVAKTLRGLKAR